MEKLYYEGTDVMIFIIGIICMVFVAVIRIACQIRDFKRKRKYYEESKEYFHKYLRSDKNR